MMTAEVRELQQRANELLRLVERGETVEIIDGGRQVAILAPPVGSPLAPMETAEEIEPATEDFDDLPEPLLLAPELESPSCSLERLRRPGR